MKKIFNQVLTGVLILSLTFSITAQDKPADKNEKQKETKKEDELARIAIVPFEDRTNSKNFVYLSESLVEAIFKSMSKEFAFEPINPKDMKKAVFNAEQELVKKKLSKKNKKQILKKKKAAAASDQDKEKEKEKTPEEIAMDEEQLKVMQAIAKDLPSEIVIFGSYKYDQATNEVVFSVRIYMAATKTTREIEDTRNLVDNTIFKATTNVAKSLVEEIHNMVEEAQKSLGPTEDAQKQKEEEKGKKFAITKKIASAPILDWNAKKFAFILSPVFGMYPSKTMVNGSRDSYEFNEIPTAEIKFWLTPNFTISSIFKNTKFTYINNNSAGNELSSHTFDLHQVLLYGGFGLISQKLLRTYIELGVGYYWGNLQSYYSSIPDPFDLDINNPVFSGRLGVDLLMLPNFMTGVSIAYSLLYDQPEPIHTVDFLFSVGIIF